MEQPLYTKDIDFTPVIFFNETLNSERVYGRLTKYEVVDPHSAPLYFEPLGGKVPSPVIIRYFSDDEWEVVTNARFIRKELRKENGKT